MSKALLFSDLHLHSHKDSVERLMDCMAVLNWVFEQAEEQGADYIFFLGDLFHERAKLDILNYVRTFETFMKHMLRESFTKKVYLLVGNHDMYHKESWDVNSIKPLSAIPQIEIIAAPTVMKIGNRRIDWMPHVDNPIKELNELKNSNAGAGDILLGHMAVHGAMLNTFYGTKADVIVEHDNDMKPVDASIFDEWKLTVLGHYHGAQQLSETAEYLGSPLELTYGEAFQQKHIMLLDLETLEKKYIVNNFSPKHLIVTPRDIKDENYKLDGNFVRISPEHVMSTKDQLDLKREIIKNHNVLSLDFKGFEAKVAEDEVVLENAKSILLDLDQMLATWVKEKGVPDGLDEATLLAKGKQCLIPISS